MKLALPRKPVHVGVVSAIGAFGYVLVHLANVGSIGAFVTAGSTYSDPKQMPHRIPVLAGDGYDGQFFYRLATAPLKLGVETRLPTPRNSGWSPL